MRKFPDSAARLVVAPRDRYAIDLLRGWGIPMVVLYGGGYNKAEGMTTELHCQTIRIAAQRHRSEREREEAKSAWSL
jgi:acetoin utilization deacetylase AcuC-like enzyme